MSEKIEHIGTRDILWSYAATFFMVGAGVIILPFILNKMSAEAVGIWNVFQTISALVILLDFGFRPSFARNISYIFTGVSSLQKEGVTSVSSHQQVDYSLLKGTLLSMQKFYKWIALTVFVFLSTAGTTYFAYILNKYTGNRTDAIIAWGLLVLINCYNLYTFYYDSLLLGKGYVKRNQQITIVSQIIYICTAIALIYTGFGLTAIVASQFIAIVIRRILTYRVFFTRDLQDKLKSVEATDQSVIFQAIVPNATKIGLTYLGGFLVNKSAMLLGTMFLSLEQMGYYGITLQVLDVLSRCAMVPYQAYTPKLAQCRAEQNVNNLRRYYLICISCLWVVFIVGGAIWMLLGNWALNIIHSQTRFVPTAMLCGMLIIGALEKNHAVSAGFILADNKVPFFIPSLLSGAATICLLLLFLNPCHMGIWGLILAPGIAQLAYQNWKWPSVVIKELFITHHTNT